MIRPKFIPLVLKQIRRSPMRSILTIAGVSVAMFLFAAVQAMHAGVELATRQRADDTTLIVYRKDRFCPFASQLPQSYEQQIRRIEGVSTVTPIKILVTNCRTSLDVVTFRGVPEAPFLEDFVPQFDVVSGSIDEWRTRSDATILGETLATRRGLKVGDRFDAAGVTAYVAAIIRSSQVQDQNVAYSHLDFLQYAAGSRAGGIVTQFNVRVTDPEKLDAVAKSIDTQFATDQEPTHTSAEKAFVARAAGDVIEIVGFMRWLGWGCLAAVLGLVANAIILSVQDRIREHAILQTLGYRAGLIARLIVTEGLVVSVLGAVVGCVAAVGFIRYSALSFSVDAFSIPIEASASTLAWGVLMGAAVGVLAGLAPAWQASRRDIVSCFRAA